jgi:hypothetical protein
MIGGRPAGIPNGGHATVAMRPKSKGRIGGVDDTDIGSPATDREGVYAKGEEGVVIWPILFVAVDGLPHGDDFVVIHRPPRRYAGGGAHQARAQTDSSTRFSWRTSPQQRMRWRPGTSWRPWRYCSPHAE